MKYHFEITYYGKVNREEGESLRDIEDAVRDSFTPDCIHGVVIEGMRISMDVKSSVTVKDASTKQE
jgi:hypothetical protein